MKRSFVVFFCHIYVFSATVFPWFPNSNPPPLAWSNPLLDMLLLCSATLTRCLVPRCSKDRPSVLWIMEWNVGEINPQGWEAKTQECVNGRDKTPFSRVLLRWNEDYAFTGRGFGDLQPPRRFTDVTCRRRSVPTSVFAQRSSLVLSIASHCAIMDRWFQVIPS